MFLGFYSSLILDYSNDLGFYGRGVNLKHKYYIIGSSKHLFFFICFLQKALHQKFKTAKQNYSPYKHTALTKSESCTQKLNLIQGQSGMDTDCCPIFSSAFVPQTLQQGQGFCLLELNTWLVLSDHKNSIQLPSNYGHL